MTPEIRVELQRLLSALVEHEIGEADHARLEELLRTDSGCVQMYLEYLDMHAKLLSDGHRSNPVGNSAPTAAKKDPASTEMKTNPTAANPTAVERSHWVRRNLRQAFLILGTVAASVLVQIFWNLVSGDSAQPDPAPPVPERRPYVATLVNTKDFERNEPDDGWQNGSRLPAGKLQVPKGIFSIRLDSGAELIVEGPAVLTMDSSTAVTVHSGKVVVRGTDSETPFDLRTPTSTLVDVNTEFAVYVDEEGEEVHVFEGEVQRVAKSAPATAEPENLKAGEARRYDSTTTKAKPAKFDTARFVRRVGASDPPRTGLPSGLLAHENFLYKDPFAMQKGKADGGFGWDGPWKATFARTHPKGDFHKSPLNVKECLARRGTKDVVEGGCFDFVGFATSFRKLAKPVRLDADRVYYLSFLFRRHGTAAHSFNSVALLLWTDDDYYQKDLQDIRKRLYIGVTGSNQLYAHFQRMTARASMPLRDGETYLLVAKIAASRSNHDQVFLRVYGPHETIESNETGTWSIQSTPFRSDHVFHWVEVHINSKTRQMIDQIRIGATWESVTSSGAS